MKRSIRAVSRTLFAVGILGALSFGAAEAFGVTLQKEARPWCDPVKCNAQCGGYGICQNNVCLCY